MSEKAAELWKRGQELDGSAKELWEQLIENNKERDWDREHIARELGLIPGEPDDSPATEAEE